MLEFKNVSVPLPEGRSSSPFSIIVQPGEVMCISGSAGSGKSLLLKAVMGLTPLQSGFITIDGELVDLGSGGFFRQMISYVPQELPEYEGTAGDIMESLCRLGVNIRRKIERKEIEAAWELLRLPPAFYSKQWSSLDEEERRLVLMSAGYLHERPILLVDNPVQNDDVNSCLKAIAARGTEVIYTCTESKLGCDKSVMLS